MTRHLIIHWESTSLDLCVADIRRDTVQQVTHSVISLDPSSLEGANRKTIDQKLGLELAEYVTRHKLTRSETTVMLDRREVELCNMTLPPAGDSELPDMVRFQALRDLNVSEESHQIDFQPTNHDPQASRSVLAAAIPSQRLQLIRKLCDEAHLVVKQVVLGPCGLGVLADDMPILADAAPAEQAPTDGADASDSTLPIRLLVDLSAAVADPLRQHRSGKLDLVVTQNHAVVMIRTVPLQIDETIADSPDPQMLVDRITPALQGTLMGAASQLGGRPIHEMVLFGTGGICRSESAAGRLADGLHESLHVPVSNFEPRIALSHVTLPSDFSGSLAMIGYLVELARTERPAFDFLNPRRRPAPIGKHGRVVLWSMVGVFALLAFFGWSWYRSTLLKDDVAQLSAEKIKLDKSLKTIELQAKQVAAVEDCYVNDFNWIQELRWLSERMPGPQEMMLNQIQISSNGGIGQIKMNGLARDESTFAPMESALRDDSHRLRGGNKAEDDSHPRYSLRFESTVYIADQITDSDIQRTQAATEADVDIDVTDETTSSEPADVEQTDIESTDVNAGDEEATETDSESGDDQPQPGDVESGDVEPVDVQPGDMESIDAEAGDSGESVQPVDDAEAVIPTDESTDDREITADSTNEATDETTGDEADESMDSEAELAPDAATPGEATDDVTPTADTENN